MARPQVLRELLRRRRMPGDAVFAAMFLAVALFLFSQLFVETEWVKRANWYAQPRFWPAVGVFGMAAFGALHFVGALASERVSGRWTEVAFWVRALEFVVWFLAYVAATPVAGYLPCTVVFCVLLALRLGFRGWALGWAALFGAATAILFRGFLQVRIPAGQVYEHLPEPLRGFALIWL